MVVILDTDHLTVIQRRTDPAYSRLRARLSKLPQDTVQTTIISFEEQMRGWLAVISKTRNQQTEVAAYTRLQILLRFFNEIPVLDYTEVVATRFEDLRRSRIPVPRAPKYSSKASDKNDISLAVRWPHTRNQVIQCFL
jgi:tRNA(fMet)-specific endonuclease VapC